MKTVEISDNNDEQRFYEVVNFQGVVTDEVYKKCPDCIDENTLCDDHFIDRFGDILEAEDWARIKTRRGTAFVERWKRYLREAWGIVGYPR